MAEHDDALLDEDFASLPDISDEDYEDVHSDKDFSTFNRQSNECNINVKVENECNVLDFEVFDQFDEELRVAELNKSLKNNKDLLYDQQIFDKNIENEKSLLYQKYIDQSQSNNSEIGISKYDLRLKLHNLYRKREINNVKDKNNKDKPTMNRIQSDNNLLSYLNTNDIYEPDRSSFIENQSSCNSTNLPHSQMNRSYKNSQILDNEHLHTFVPDQSWFLYNQNMGGNYIMHHPQMQPASFPMNQNFSINPTFPVHQNLAVNQTLSHMGGIMSNSHADQNVMSTYPQLIFSYQPNECPNLSQYTAKPYNIKGHKILVNRDFRKSQTEREVKILHNDEEYNEFLKINSSFPNNCKNFKFNQHDTKNYDPYSYFSDVWQEKKSTKNDPKSFSPEIVFSNTNEFNKSKRNFRKQYEQTDLEMSLSGKHEALQKKKVSFSHKNDESLRNSKRKNIELQKRKRLVQNQTIDRNNNCDKINNFKKQKNAILNPFYRKRNINKILKKEVELDPQMREYCRKVEEQKLLREKLLVEKENRRKMLAMEKLGIKNKPFINTLDLEIQQIIDTETNCQQKIKGIQGPPIIELNN